MAKEVIRPEQFGRVSLLAQEEFQLNEEQLNELDALLGSAVEMLQQGKLVTGRIISIDNSGAVVDIEYKSNGIIPRYEFSERELKEFKTGDEIDVILDEIESVEGNVILSYEKAKALKAWERITKLFDDGEPVEGTVINTVKGGLIVDIGIPAFLPGSQVDLQRVTNFDGFIGQTIIAKILKINKKRGNVIISRRQFLSDEREGARKKILETIEEGSVIQGIAKNITNYGVFIDIGGIDGLLHITDMTWGRISHPSEIVNIGDQITVKVLTIDKEHNKISLGMKQLSGNPWNELTDTIKEGSRVKGKISSITDYGLFVAVQPGVEGLVHISEVSWTDRVNDLSKLYSVGGEVEAVVVSLDKDNRRMSLSIKQIEDNPWKSIKEKFTTGDKVEGTVSNVTDFGVFIQLVPGIDGLAHVSDLSWTEHIDHPGDLYKRGDKVDAIVLNIDEESKKISLGVKQLSQDPWDSVDTDYSVGSLIEGTVSKITNFGAFIKLASGIEGLVHVSDFPEREGIKLADALKIGEKRDFRIVNINKDDRKLGLSTKLSGTISAAPQPRARVQHNKTESRSEGPKPKTQMQLALEKMAASANDNE